MCDLRMAVINHLIDELIYHDEILPHEIFIQAPAEVIDHVCHLDKQLQHEGGEHVPLLRGEHKEQLISLDIHKLNALLLLCMVRFKVLTKNGAVRF